MLAAVIIAVIIGLANDNNLWLYLALGFSLLGGLLKAARTVSDGAPTSQSQTDALNALLTALHAKNN